MEPMSVEFTVPSEKIFNLPRIITLLGCIIVALGSGTGYIYSAYAPQLGTRLRLSHTQLNIIGLAGNFSGYITGPAWGRIADHKGPRIPLICASICLFTSYFGIKQVYDNGIGNGATVSTFCLALLVICNIMIGLGENAGYFASVNATARSFPSSVRATTTGLVVSGVGLSAFMFSLIAHALFPGDTSALLLILALGTSTLMLIGFFTIKLVPPPVRNCDMQLETTIAGYGPIPSDDDATVFIGGSQLVLDSEVDAEVDGDRTLLVFDDEERSLEQVSTPPSIVELNSPASLHCDVGDKEGLLDIHGKRLWLTPDFYVACTILTICGGTGIMCQDINNVGSISRVLYATAHPVYDDVEASKWQATQVSILSLGNFAGRVLIGLTSDFAYTRFRLPRAYCLCIVSSLFVISQATAIAISSVETLWIATLILGLAYGSLFGSYPTVMIEWFGLAHFSENWGYAACSPIIGGSLFSFMFGRNLDAHARTSDTSSSLETRIQSLVSLASRDLPSEYQCFDGKACYVESLHVTLIACIVSLGLSWWAGIRDGQKTKGRNAYIELKGQSTT